MNALWLFKLAGIRLRQARDAYRRQAGDLPGFRQLRKRAFVGGLIGLMLCLSRGGYAWIPLTLWGAAIGAASLPFARALRKTPPVSGHWLQACVILLSTRLIVGIISPYFSILKALHLL